MSPTDAPTPDAPTTDAPAPDAPATLPVASARASWRRVRGLLGRRWLALTGVTVLLLAGSAAVLLVPLALGAIVDAVISGAAFSRILLGVGVILGAGAASALLLRWGGRLLVAVLQGALAALREQVFAAAITLDQGRIESAGSSDVVSRVTGDVEAITGAVSDVLPRFVQATFTIGLTAIGLAVLDPWLALAALLAVPIQVFATVRFLARSRPLYRRLRQEESERGQAIIEAVNGADTVVAHGARDTHLERVASRSLTAVQTEIEATNARNRFNAGLNAAEFVGLGSILAVGFWQSATAGLTVGAVTAAALLFHRLFGPIGALLSSLDDLQRAAAGLGRLVGVLQAEPEHVQRHEISGSSIRLHGVDYAYGTSARLAVANVSLEIPAGSTTLVVGVSGSGKSTLAQLIAGVFAPVSGTVQVGGVDAMAAASDGKRAVQLVTQDTHLFVGTLADNLRLADPTADDDTLWRALDVVGADWARELPERLDTVLGATLDDASVQQLALARVVLADPPVVVLDEATAHGGADGALDRAVQAVVQDRTAVIVAHRFTHAALADRVVVLENGRVIEDGTQEELLALPDGTYARLHRASVAG